MEIINECNKEKIMTTEKINNMEYEKTTHFLGNITNQPYKFRTKN